MNNLRRPFLSSVRLANFGKRSNFLQFNAKRSISDIPNPSKSSFATKIGLLLGIASLPVIGFVAYDRIADLPDEFQNMNFPLPARFYIRRALCPANSIDKTAKYLDLAMQKVLEAGIGSASPESTALVLFLARLYLEAKNVSIFDLEAAHYALTFKPHVGEAVREEIARIELSFPVAERLCDFYSSSGHENKEKVQFFATRSLELMDKGPSYLHGKFSNHPLKPKFKQYLQ